MSDEQLINLNMKDPHLFGMCSSALRSMMGGADGAGTSLYAGMHEAQDVFGGI